MSDRRFHPDINTRFLSRFRQNKADEDRLICLAKTFVAWFFWCSTALLWGGVCILCSWTTSGFCFKLSSAFSSEFKALKSYSRNRFSRSVLMTNPGNVSVVGGAHWAQLTPDKYEGEFSGTGPLPSPVSNSLKVTHRYVCVYVCV